MEPGTQWDAWQHYDNVRKAATLCERLFLLKLGRSSGCPSLFILKAFQKGEKMVIVERLTQKLRPNKFEELEKLDKKYTALENKFGFPLKKRYQLIAGGNDFNTLIVERHWESLAKMEAAYEKALADAEYQKLNEESSSAIKSTQMELYTPLP